MARGLTDTDVANFRERLCETAARLFVERGPGSFNMRELASRLGVSAMTPYRYFKDKTEILPWCGQGRFAVSPTGLRPPMPWQDRSRKKAPRWDAPMWPSRWRNRPVTG